MAVTFLRKGGRPAAWVVGLTLVGILGAGGIALRISQGRRAQHDLARLTVPAQTETLQVRIPASGKVEPNQRVNLSPKVAGQLVRLYVEQGDRVQAGQILAQMDNAELLARRQQLQAALAQADARLQEIQAGFRTEEIAQVEAQVRAAQARYTLSRQRRLRNEALAAEGAISKDTLDGAIAEEEANAATLKEVQRRLDLYRIGNRPEEIAQVKAATAQARAELRVVDVQLADTVVRAPFAGLITQKYAAVGAFVTPTTSASTTTSATSTSIVALASELEVVAKVAETDINQIRSGQKVEIQADAFPGRTFQGVVRLIAPEAVIEQNITAFEVRIRVLTGQTELRSGMNVDVTFLGEGLVESLVVPTVAIVTEKGEAGVLVPDANGRPVFRAITPGLSLEDKTQVLQGLRPGERVFINLPPGTLRTSQTE